MGRSGLCLPALREKKMIYFALDGGGSKTIAMCYSDDMRLLGIGHGGGVNTNFESIEAVREHIAQAIDECLERSGVREVQAAYMAGPGPHDVMRELLNERAKVADNTPYSMGEAMNGVHAGLCGNTGLSVLSGTGSNVGYILTGKYAGNAGGWGAFIGDEGSGCWIGTRAIQAAIAGHDQWGPKTVLEDMLMERWHLDDLHGVIPRVFLGRSMRVEISPVSRMVGEAARQGDEVSIQILKDAGEILARQARALIRRASIPLSTPVVTIGSAWKSAPVMHQSFTEHLHEEFPGMVTHRSLFDQIMGSVVVNTLRGRDELSEEEKQHLIKEFEPFLSE